METGDKVLALLLAKVACCVGRTLAATGALGGLGVWLLDGAGRWLLGAALIGLILAVVLRGSKRAAATSLAQDPAHREPKRLEPQR
jgi:hypothetical protein